MLLVYVANIFADLMIIDLWGFTLNQTAARVPGIKVKEGHLQPTLPPQALAAPPTSLPNYTLRLLRPVARFPLQPLKQVPRWPPRLRLHHLLPSAP